MPTYEYIPPRRGVLSRAVASVAGPAPRRGTFVDVDGITRADNPDNRRMDADLRTFRQNYPELARAARAGNLRGSVSAPPRRNILERYVEHVDDYLHHTSYPALAARAIERAIPVDRDYRAEMERQGANRGHYRARSTEQLQQERRDRRVQDERDWRELRDMREAADPSTADGTMSPFEVGLGITLNNPGAVRSIGARRIADIAGDLTGAAVSDPTNMISPGGSLPRQMLAQAVIGAAADLSLQGAENVEGTRDGIDPTEAIVSTLAGPAMVGLAHGIHRLSGRGADIAPEASRVSEPEPEVEAPVHETVASDGYEYEAPAVHSEPVSEDPLQSEAHPEATGAGTEAVTESVPADPEPAPVIDPEGIFREAAPTEDLSPLHEAETSAETPVDHTPDPEVVDRLTTALNDAQRSNLSQRELQTEARREKLRNVRGARAVSQGESGFHAELSQLKGELPRVDFDGVRHQFSQGDIDGLFDSVKNNSSLSIFDQINARAGLAGLLDGRLPTRSQIDLLSRVFPPDFIKSAMKNRSLMSRILQGTSNALNLPRSLMSSVDLSAPFRQGLFLVARKEFWSSFRSMFHQFGSERAFAGVMDDIRSRGTYPLMEEAGLSLSSLGHDLSAREEAFVSQWAEKIPVVGRVVRASERGYTGFLNKLRADTFDSLVRLSRDADVDFNRNPQALSDIASFVNNATGRGSLGKLSQAGPLLNGIFFSPKLMASRITLLNPAYYVTLSPVVRREAVKALLSTGAIATTILGLASAAGLNVETDPRSSDFAKIRAGNTRFDILGGFGQYITLAARMATNSTRHVNGEVNTLGQRYGADTRLDVLGQFLSSKESPVASYVTDYLRGSNIVGEPFNPASGAAERFIPMFLHDVYDEVKERGPEGLLTSAPGMFGVGVQTFNTPHGYDVYGRDFHDVPSTETDPAFLEVQRLNTEGGQLIGRPGRSVTIDGQRRRLSDEEYGQYERRAGEYIATTLRSEMASPDWIRMSDDDKREEVRSIARDMRANARDELFSGTIQSSDGYEYESGPATVASPSSAPTTSGVTYEYGGTPGQPVASAASIVLSLFPGVHINQEHRDPNSRLGRANPGSWHNQGRAAVDVRPIRGMTFEAFIQKIRDAGYDIIEDIDEVRHPSRNATGPHWHVVIRERGRE